MIRLERREGFTLIELMITVAIVGILAAIAVPKFSNLVNKSKEATTLGNLGILRSALTIYYTDTEGFFPSFPPPYSQPAGYGTLLEDVLVPKYLAVIPQAKPSQHRPSSRVLLVWNLSGTEEDETTDTGDGWKYDANPFEDIKPVGYKGKWGSLQVLCSHRDSKGNLWTSY